MPVRDPKELKRLRFNFNPDRCVGCGACVGACVDEHDAFPIDSEPIRKLRKTESVRAGKVNITWYSLACVHCAQPKCSQVCPKNCFSVDENTQTVQLDSSRCVGCGACAKACEYDAIRFTPDNKATKCDGCIKRLKFGMQPRCVAACPAYALTIDERPAVVEKSHEQVRKALATRKMQLPT
jgi:Fe-S-cluster-containing dehydrogenase component